MKYIVRMSAYTTLIHTHIYVKTRKLHDGYLLLLLYVYFFLSLSLSILYSLNWRIWLMATIMIFFGIVNYTLKDFMEKYKLSFSLRIVHIHLSCWPPVHSIRRAVVCVLGETVLIIVIIINTPHHVSVSEALVFLRTSNFHWCMFICSVQAYIYLYSMIRCERGRCRCNIYKWMVIMI